METITKRSWIERLTNKCRTLRPATTRSTKHTLLIISQIQVQMVNLLTVRMKPIRFSKSCITLGSAAVQARRSTLVSSRSTLDRADRIIRETCLTLLVTWTSISNSRLSAERWAWTTLRNSPIAQRYNRLLRIRSWATRLTSTSLPTTPYSLSSKTPTWGAEVQESNNITWPTKTLNRPRSIQPPTAAAD